MWLLPKLRIQVLVAGLVKHWLAGAGVASERVLPAFFNVRERREAQGVSPRLCGSALPACFGSAGEVCPAQGVGCLSLGIVLRTGEPWPLGGTLQLSRFWFSLFFQYVLLSAYYVLSPELGC